MIEIRKSSDGVIRTVPKLSPGSKKAVMEAVRARRERRRKIRGAYKYLFSAVGVLFLVLILALSVRPGRKGSGETAAEAENASARSAGTGEEGPETVEPSSVADDENRVTFTAVGDNLIHGSIYQQARIRTGGDGYDFSFSYDPVKPFFLEHDVNWINMETICNNQFQPSNYPRFSTPGQDALDLYDAGFRIFSVASNHTYDYGNAGVRAMKYFYRDEMPEDILTTGLWEDTDYIPVYECKGHKIAFLTYTYGMNEDSNEESGRVIFLSEQGLIKRQITKAKEKADCVIVSCHWGDEDKHAINDEQRALARNIAEWGADLIIGTHPHVVQDYTRIETSDGRQVFCVYSIGNFISGQKDLDHLVGLILECTLAFSQDADGETKVTVEDPKLIPTVTHYDEAFTNLRVMLLKDYTPELADRHGVHKYDEFSYDEIFDMLGKYVIGDVLDLPEKKQRIS